MSHADLTRDWEPDIDVPRWVKEPGNFDGIGRTRAKALLPIGTRLGEVVICNEVQTLFQRTENRTNSDNAVSGGITFDQFEREIGTPDAKLKAGGLLFIDHADFNFMDTVHAEQYDVLEFDQNRVQHDRPLFDRNNRKVSDDQCLYRAFVKRR